MATCPNCKAELVEVNGRYICSECGKEVPAAEVNVGTWGDPVQQATAAADGAELAVENQSVVEPDDYIADQETGKAVETEPAAVAPAPEVETIVEAAKPVEEVIPAPTPSPESVVAEEPPADGFYNAEKTVEDKPAPDPVTESQPESPKEAEAVPMPEETKVEALASVPTAAPQADIAPADPLYQLPHEQTNAMPAESEFYEQPEGELKDEIKEPLPPASQPLPQDANIYTDPQAEVASDETGKDGMKPGQVTPTAVPQNKEGKLNRNIIIAGTIVAVLLLIGGIIAYLYFSSRSNVATNTGSIESTETNCDQEGSDTAKNACIAKAFTACDVATWSGTYPGTADGQNRKISYEIEGVANDKCQVNQTMVADTVNTDTVGKDMACLYDNTTTFDKAQSTNSATVCTGDLANILFGSSPSTTNTDTGADTGTDTSDSTDTGN